MPVSHRHAFLRSVYVGSKYFEHSFFRQPLTNQAAVAHTSVLPGKPELLRLGFRMCWGLLLALSVLFSVTFFLVLSDPASYTVSLHASLSLYFVHAAPSARNTPFSSR